MTGMILSLDKKNHVNKDFFSFLRYGQAKLFTLKLGGCSMMKCREKTAQRWDDKFVQEMEIMCQDLLIKLFTQQFVYGP